MSKKKTVQSNVVTVSNHHQDELEWDAEALFTKTIQVEEYSTLEVVEVPSFMATTVEVEEEHASSASSSNRINYEKC